MFILLLLQNISFRNPFLNVRPRLAQWLQYWTRNLRVSGWRPTGIGTLSGCYVMIDISLSLGSVIPTADSCKEAVSGLRSKMLVLVNPGAMVSKLIAVI